MDDRTKWKTDILIPQATPDLQARSIFLKKIQDEVDRAIKLHGNPYWARHTFWGVFKEEVDEVWDDIKADSDPDVLLKELIQTAAMILKFVETCPPIVKELKKHRLP